LGPFEKIFPKRLKGLRENSGFLMKVTEGIPQGLKPTLILLPLRHD
jgi:hypothetical protein